MLEGGGTMVSMPSSSAPAAPCERVKWGQTASAAVLTAINRDAATGAILATYSLGDMLRGIALMCTASTLFPVMLALVQALSARYGTAQLVWARQLSQLIFLLAMFGPTLGSRLIRTSHLGWQVLRSALLLGSTLFLYAGATFLPLARSTTITLIGPFFVALLAWPALGERLTRPRLLATAIGFVGAWFVIQPTGKMFHPASLLLVGAAFCYALFQILTRYVGRKDHPETSAVFSVMIGTVVLTFYMPFGWTPIVSGVDLALMFLLGMLGGLGHYCLALAFVRAPANLLAPFVYWQLVGAVVVGYVVSGELPDGATSIGAAIIVGAGLALAWTETRPGFTARRAA
jgi:drug/metabolite transporter (DMT)-like permease